jgi:succinate-acetate transporter protein
MNSMILAMGLCYGGLAQIIAGIFEFKRGDLFGMVAFLSYGLFWWSLIFLIVFPKLGNFATPTDPIAFGCYLFIWGLFSLCMFFGTILKRAPWALTFVFFTVVVLFWLLAISKWAESEAVEVVAGVEGVICGLSAIYLAFAQILQELSGRVILPMGIRSA